ncbi:glycoside hydrolase family 35 protein [Lepidopterella palustris CBS 459.81]|uniref:Glycoside hydrolase family 35 protein n=1 Tax=Lepidopterella palustris CBS 459.81 TaxID=1314670 RepID=A0A8E2E3J0_9PEZI|nr:glycoside hydrolase family 35 protein [Lepidopterella palustris CBS 459.81]
MCGKFHYKWTPVPEYHLLLLISPPNGELHRVLGTAKQAGLYAIARPGPYYNAETNAERYTLLTSDGSSGNYRTSDETSPGLASMGCGDRSYFGKESGYERGPSHSASDRE